MEGHRDEVVIRKGPWMAEEDEILMDYVRKYGPRDWSSIRSKGLLPRTGKSCRLRWVNKLKPNLKTGCKFSAEEERVVIDFQARFGNKWARIATYLPGRTDNDVKNFWSTRQKRLARILQTTPQQLSKSQRNNGKRPMFHEVSTLEVARFGSIPMEIEGSSSKCQSCPPTFMEASELIKMVPLPDLVNQNLINMEINLPQSERAPSVKKPCIDSLTQFPFQLPQPQLDLPLLPVSQEFVPGLEEPNFLDAFTRGETSSAITGPQFTAGESFFGFNGSRRSSGKLSNKIPATPDTFFDDFPTDMFDHLEPLPSSSEW